MKKTLTSILVGTSLIGSLFFNSCKYEKPQTKIKETQTSSEDTLLKTGAENYIQGDYNKAKENYSKFLEIKKNKKDSLGIAKGFNNLGLVFMEQGNYNGAVKYNLDALEIYENLKDSLRIAQTSNNLGIIFDAQEKYEKALEYYNKSLDIKKNINDSLGISKTLNNLAGISEKQNKDNEALKYYFNSLEIANKINNKEQEALCYNNIAVLYNKQEEIDKAFEYYQKSLETNKEIRDNENLALNLRNISNIYRKKGNYFQALKNLNNSLEIAKEINNSDLLAGIFKDFSETYESKGELDSALKYFKKFSETKDTLLNSESLKQVAELETKYQTEKKEGEIKLLNKNKELNETQIKQQKRNLWGLAGLLGLAAIAGGISYRAYRTNKKAKEKEKEANKLLEEKNKIIEKQKAIVEEKNEEITDSIKYARTIQTSILPRDEEFKRALPESFVLYKPKDIVSGDFYWLNERNNKIYFSASDCTGHGVPGAFMSMLNSRLLSEAVNEKQIEKPNEIFNYVRKSIISSLKSTSKIGEQKDGMDSTLCSLDKNSNTLEFACANNPLYLIRNNELTEYKADKMPVAYSDALKDFSLNKIDLQKNDLIYILSDGYQDQFGGAKEKKFMRKNLKELLLSIHNKPMSEQKETLNKTIEEWMTAGKQKQMDDILVIGVRFREILSRSQT